MENWHNLTRKWYTIPKALLRLCFIILNNLYAIPTYVVWMILLTPLRRYKPDVYWRIEGLFFHWLLAMVSLWSWSAGYDIVEAGDDISECTEERTLVIANHQSTGDVPMLMACFNSKKHVLPNIMWIMDRLFKFTNFGIVSVLHKDFFIMSGKRSRDKSLRELAEHLLNSYVPLERKWVVLFPEGGFLRKRKLVSQKYAQKNNLPVLENVSLPRVGALQVIMDTVGPSGVTPTGKLKWILDITIAYPDGQPIDLCSIVFGHRPPCRTVLFYRVFECANLPADSEKLTQWLFARWEEKEHMLAAYYKTGDIPAEYSRRGTGPAQVVAQDLLRFLLLHLFLIVSTYLHWQLAWKAVGYCGLVLD